MPFYQLTFTPQAPYFFGNEKTFSFVGEPARYGKLYYIKGERLPSQSTVFGALRYLLLPEKTFAGAARAADRIGPESFRMGAEGQRFGAIRAISPLFLCRGEEWFIPAPLDHNTAAGNERYTPFAQYEPMMTPKGERWYAKDYAAKRGLTDGFLSLADAHIESGLFTPTLRVGIQRGKDLFKREFQCLRSGFSFSILAQLDDEELEGRQDVVYMGQGKTTFTVRFSQRSEENAFSHLEEKVRGPLSERHAGRPYLYCLSDVLIDLPADGTVARDLYAGVPMAVTQAREYRAYQTAEGGRIRKDSTLLRLLRAGSILIGTDKAPAPDTARQANARTAGFNWMIGGEEK